jgi:hypothetical protein
MQSEEFVEIALSSVEREIEATRDRLRRLTEVADQLRQRRSSAAPAVAPTSVTAAPATAPARRRRKHNMSPEARKKLSERMRRRWDEYRKGKTKTKGGK